MNWRKSSNKHRSLPHVNGGWNVKLGASAAALRQRQSLFAGFGDRDKAEQERHGGVRKQAMG